MVMTVRALWVGTLLVAVAGCVEPTPKLDVENDLAAGDGVLPPSVLKWKGRLTAGAADEIPARIAPAGAALRGHVDTSFHFQVEDVPQQVVVEVAWEAKAASLMLLVSEPIDDPDPEVRTLPENPAAPGKHFYTSESPICMVLDGATLRRGDWPVVVHSLAAADVTLDFTVTSRGGEVQVLDEPLSFEDARDLIDMTKDQVNPVPDNCGHPCPLPLRESDVGRADC